MSDVFFGIDLGTSNSSIAYVADDPRYRKQQTVPVHVVKIPTDPAAREKPDRLPSIVAQNFVDRRVRRPLIGWEFLDACFRPRARIEPLRHGENLFRSVKSDMGTNRVYPWAFDENFNTPVKVSRCSVERNRGYCPLSPPGRSLGTKGSHPPEARRIRASQRDRGGALGLAP